ncbi:hypothetical protein R3W88_001450 [Solanum pinnatisectum]|uniref:Uncharacterized protein n=1 Tax=Solanum pinnatisectum TaxID=50273 RepID=A0AAV9MIE0_9SOLN|nr:hypothetical protein R3W88_001450 [Solanum pinnatisectum]
MLPFLSKKPATAVAAKKPPKFYSVDDIKKHFVNKHKSKPIKLRLMISNLKKERFLLKKKRRKMCFLKRVVELKKKKKKVGCEEEEM